MEQRLVVINEAAPRLKGFDSGSARKFLREYIAHENRLETMEAQIPLRRCIEPDDLSTLLECSEDMATRVVRQFDGRAAYRARVNIETPLTATSARVARDLAGEHAGNDGADEQEEKGEEGNESEDDSSAVLYLSNAHVEAMLVHVLGPTDITEVVNILRGIKMNRDRGSAFANLGIATTYVREWKDSMRWGKNHLPPEKILVKHFLAGIQPKNLGFAVENLGLKRIKPV